MANENKFSFNTVKIDDVHCISINGFLDAHTANLLENEMQRIINDGNYKLLVNFQELDYISSAGLGVFMTFIEDVRMNNGDIKMFGMSDKVFSVFDLLGFPMIFDIQKDDKVLLDRFARNEIKE